MTAELSVVLPCYNESGNLQSLLNRYRPLTQSVSLELILVDNGSTDNTADVLACELAKKENAFVRVVKVDKNIGYGHGIQAGLAQAQASVVAYSHADMQCPPEDIFKAYSLYQKEAQNRPCVIKGRRQGPRPIVERIITWFYNGLTFCLLNISASSVILGAAEDPALHVADINAQPKLFPHSLVPTLARGPKDFAFDLFSLYACRQLGYSILEFDVHYDNRGWGKSKLAANPWVRLQTAFRAFIQMIRMRTLFENSK
jgi:glycosyltransferase involved in cell wall biosynthesis